MHKKGIAIDATHGSTGYGFLLTNVMILDEWGQGFPPVRCISNHEDFTHIFVVFKHIQMSCGILKPQWLMSDTAEQFYNAWIGVMGDKPKKLLCT